MAGLGRKDFEAGQVLSAADVNGYLMDQSVQRFASAAARDTAIPTPSEGMVCYLDDVNQIELYNGSAWVDQESPLLSEGTAGQYLQSNGAAGSQWVTSPSPDDLITTQGDLIIGDASGDASRIAIGAEGTTLTSNGTTATWAASSGGGGEVFFLLPFETISTLDITLLDTQTYRLSVISTSGSPVTFNFFDADDGLIEARTVDRDFPFTYYAPSAEVAQVQVIQDTDSVNPVIGVISDPEFTGVASKDILVITSTQSITLTKTFNAFLLGGGGGGGGLSNETRANGAGGGGSGFFTTGTVTAGTYTATVGSGGGGTRFAATGGTGGSTSIDALTAAGGSGGGSRSGGQEIGGTGGNGGSGGGGGGAGFGGNFAGGTGGYNGAAGANGTGTGTPGTGGTGSTVVLSGTITFPQFGDSPAYKGGNGGKNRGAPNGATAASATKFGGGGNGGDGSNEFSTDNVATGGNGFAGLIILVEA